MVTILVQSQKIRGHLTLFVERDLQDATVLYNG